MHCGDPYEKEKREYESESMRGSAEWRQEGSRIRVRERRRRRTHFAFFLFLNYDGFLLRPTVNLITYNILRRFSMTVLECVS